MSISVFPTPVGMNRAFHRMYTQPISVPHARGDEPVVDFLALNFGKCSPRPWG